MYHFPDDDAYGWYIGLVCAIIMWRVGIRAFFVFLKWDGIGH